MVWAPLKQSTHNPADPKEESIPTGYQKSEARGGGRHTRDVIESGEGTEGRLVMANEKSEKEKRKLGDQPLKVLRTSEMEALRSAEVRSSAQGNGWLTRGDEEDETPV